MESRAEFSLRGFYYGVQIVRKIGDELGSLPSITDSSATSSPRLKTSQLVKSILAEAGIPLNEPDGPIFAVPGA
jgi:hypothetical protein